VRAGLTRCLGSPRLGRSLASERAGFAPASSTDRRPEKTRTKVRRTVRRGIFEYAAWISKHWNVRDFGSGYVTRFAVDSEFLKRYPIQRVGAGPAEELWVPADELDQFNRTIVGKIEVIAEFDA
jgi:hypothetical protein